jgi:hypothetical protein
MPGTPYFTMTTADVGKVLGFPLNQSNGNTNNFTGASANLMVRDQNGNLQAARPMVFNAATVEWEYSVRAGDFAPGRYWAMVAVTFPGPVGPIYSTEVVFDVIAAD